jgi:hypothetical protein
VSATVDRRARAARYATAALALTLLTAACAPGGGTLKVTGAPAPTGRFAASCQALLRALPGSLGPGLGRRQVSPSGVSAAAWGTGPVLLTCGAAGSAPGFQPTSEVEGVNGVDWFPEQLSGRTRWSTPTRAPQVVVLIPADVPPDEVLVTLANAVTAHTASTIAG